jgi:hypothetical protein
MSKSVREVKENPVIGGGYRLKTTNARQLPKYEIRYTNDEMLTDFNKLVFSAAEADFFGVFDLPFAVKVRVF